MTRAGLVAPGQPLPTSFSVPVRARLTLEVLLTYARVRWMYARRDTPELVRVLRGGVRDAHAVEDAIAFGSRLGHPVRRVLDPLPWDSRCLMRSLVLLTMLARRGITADLVIGVEPGAEFRAHAWIEHAGHPLLPHLGYHPLTRI